MKENEICITDEVADGNVDHIIDVLKAFRSIGYDKLDFNGYDASISLYKSNQPERSKREGFVKWTHPRSDSTGCHCLTKMRCSEHGGDIVRDK